MGRFRQGTDRNTVPRAGDPPARLFEGRDERGKPCSIPRVGVLLSSVSGAMPYTHPNAGIGAAELRQMLSGMRSDHLLAASLAGTLDGLRDVMAKALIATADGKATIWSTPRWCRAASSIRATPAARCSPESPEPSSATTPAALWCKAGWPPTAGCQTAWRRSR